jgi:hypothetical protein
MELPAASALVQRQNLRCISDAGYVTTPKRSPDDCLAMYALDTPGLYRVVVEYFGREVWADIDSLDAAPDRRSALDLINRPLAEGLHLADTLTFLVVKD